jgi:hypothetical protein
MVPDTDVVVLRRINPAGAYPAPLCEACNEPMAFVGEYGSAPEKRHREFHCRLCSLGKIVRRSNTAPQQIFIRWGT